MLRMNKQAYLEGWGLIGLESLRDEKKYCDDIYQLYLFKV